MNKKRFVLPLLLSGFIMFGSCEKRPDGVLSDNEMVALLTDMQLAESYSEIAHRGGGYGRAQSEIADGVLAAHGISRSEFDASMEWYGRNLDVYNELFKKVDKEISKRRVRLMKDSGLPEESASESMWPYSPHIVLSRLGNSDNLTFSIPADGLNKGDVLVWKLHLNFTGDLIGMLGVDYSDGSSGLVNRNNMGNPAMEIRLQTDTAKTPTRIFGVLRARQSMFSPVWADSIALVSEPFDSTKYYSLHSVSRILPLRPRPAKLEEKDSVSEEHPEVSSIAAPGSATAQSSVGKVIGQESGTKGKKRKMNQFGMPDVHDKVKIK